VKIKMKNLSIKIKSLINWWNSRIYIAKVLLQTKTRGKWNFIKYYNDINNYSQANRATSDKNI
jgi:hypothetical protein